MTIFEATITPKTISFLQEILIRSTTFDRANDKIFDAVKIRQFFDNEDELVRLKETLQANENIVQENERSEYGDFQTNPDLAGKVTEYLHHKGVSPEIIVEPTCGKGNFIIACLNKFSAIRTIVGVEIYKPYVWKTKFNIIDFYLRNPEKSKPAITVHHCSVFDFDFRKIATKNQKKRILVIGNPPWVTNSKLGTLNSINLPRKVNFKNHSGLDAMTGKGNFDIAESITNTLLQSFQNLNGHMALLVKNSVVKNFVHGQKREKYAIANIEKLVINSKKEFNVSVEAALFFGQLNTEPAVICTEYSFYNYFEKVSKFGWVNDNFVSNIKTYKQTAEIDGICPFEWRQGLKHDCSKIMEFDKIGQNQYINSLGEEIELEEQLVYGLLKSSDLKNNVISDTRKHTIVTQKKVGQETSYIKSKSPKTYDYLQKHRAYFDARKSSIYVNKPSFSIFGIGDYSFEPYKVAISGLYKNANFTLVLPQNGKPIMLDDTCYMLGFDSIEFAVYTLLLLNSPIARNLLESITFPDAKRMFTKDILMRIDLKKIAAMLDKSYIQKQLVKLNIENDLNVSMDIWEDFLKELQPAYSKQVELFV